jgi:very-short-patch-repair endonuclease
MWRVLHPFRTGGYHFRKQVAIGPYVADFVCHHAMLVIEVDGEQHARTQRNDELRDEYMQARGFKVLRIPSTALIDNHEGVYKLIAAALENVPPRPRVPPSLAPLGPDGPSSATLPARGRVAGGEVGGITRPHPQAPTSPLAGEVAQLGAKRPSEARRGVGAGTEAPQPDQGKSSLQPGERIDAPQPQAPTSSLAGEVAQLGAKRPSGARRGVEAGTDGRQPQVEGTRDA